MYKLIPNGWPMRVADGAAVNPDSDEYLQWLSEGNTPEPADIPPAPTYKELRAAAYPPLFDLIDGLVKDDTAQIEAYKAACLAVKAKYQKDSV